MRVWIDTDRCSGHGRCYALAPDVFDADDRGYGLVSIEGALPDDLVTAARLAVDSCPEQAIHLET